MRPQQKRFGWVLHRDDNRRLSAELEHRKIGTCPTRTLATTFERRAPGDPSRAPEGGGEACGLSSVPAVSSPSTRTRTPAAKPVPTCRVLQRVRELAF